MMDQMRPVNRNTGFNHVARHGHQQPDGAALRSAGRSITWHELAEQVERLAGAFSRRGLGHGDRLVILMTNQPEFLVAMYAANRLGAIVVPVNFRLTPNEIAYILQDSEPVLCLAEHALAPAASEALGMTGLGAGLVVSGGVHDGAEDLADLVREEALADAVDVAEDAPAMIIYTSGTTGKPKGAVLSHGNILGQALTTIRFYRMVGSEEVYLLGTPLFHVGGVGSISATILLGGTVVFPPPGSFDPASTIDLIADERVTNTFLVPAQLQMMANHPRAGERDVSSLRNICWGGAPATDRLLTEISETFPGTNVIAGFGQTEMSPMTCVMAPEDALRKLGSVGRPVPTVWWRIVDDDMNDVADGDVGEIVYRGPTTMLGYWRDPEANAEAFAGGWFHSGDLVRRDEDGFIWVVDRKKDMIISGGENIYSAELENVIAGHPAVRDVAVIARDDERWGEVPVAVAVLASPLTVEDLRAWASSRLARYKLPADLVEVDSLPRNASGKVLKASLRHLVNVTEK